MISLFKISSSLLMLCCSGLFLTASAQVQPTPAAERMNGLQQRKLLEKKSLLNDIHFRNIGPVQMNGRVVDIDVNPADPTEFYVAYASGGLWHTLNNGLSFEPVFDKEDVISIGDIAVNWKERLIWVGTGEVNSSRSSYSGNGVYKSADGGKTWQYLGLPESHHIGEIILHPADKNIAWVAVMGHLYSANKERGVYKTTDGGITWKQTLFVDDNTGAVEMDINLQNPLELYACTWYRMRRAWDWVPYGKTSGIYKSVDGGETWKLVTGAGSGFPSGEKTGRCGVAVFAGDPRIVYAVVDNNEINRKPAAAPKKKDSTTYELSELKNISKEKFALLDNKRLDTFLLKNDFPSKYTAIGLKELVKTDKLKPTDVYDWLVADDGFQNDGIYGCEIYRSDDAGMHWKKVNEKDIDVYSSYGYYFGKLYVSPADANKVITFGISMLLSTNGGKTFEVVDKNNTHGDWHCCWINPARDGYWVAGNDGGCNITYDDGKKWFKVTSVPAAQFYNITVDDAKPYHVYGGLQDNGSWMGEVFTPSPEENTDPEPEAYAWKPVGDGDGMQVQIDTRDNKTLYAGFQFGYYFRTVDGNNPMLIHPMHDLGETKLRYNWQTPIWLSKHSQGILYYGSNHFHRSLTKGENMQSLSPDLSKGKHSGKIPYGTITSISESPLKFGLIYAGTDDGNIQLSKDGGYTWTLVSGQLPAHLWVSRVVASKYKEGRVYATLNGYRYDHFKPYLFVSDDYGASWRPLGSDLSAEPLNVVKEDERYEDIIYIGSDNGLYASFNQGQSFMTVGKDLPRVPVHDIVIQSRENDLLLGTHGRSIYVANLNELHQLYSQWKTQSGK